MAINTRNKTMSDMRKLLETVTESPEKNPHPILSRFRPPFRSNGLWVSDSRGTSVLECVTHDLSKEVAQALNQFVGAKPW